MQHQRALELPSVLIFSLIELFGFCSFTTVSASAFVEEQCVNYPDVNVKKAGSI